MFPSITQPDEGAVFTTSLALGQVEADALVGRVLRHADLEHRLHRPPDLLTAAEAAGGTAAPVHQRVGRGRGAELRIEAERAEDGGSRHAELLGHDRHGLRRHIAEVMLNRVETGEELAGVSLVLGNDLPRLGPELHIRHATLSRRPAPSLCFVAPAEMNTWVWSSTDPSSQSLPKALGGGAGRWEHWDR